jgi:hypothetical protein
MKDMSYRILYALLLGMFAATVALPAKRNNDPGAARTKANRHDPAFRAGYMDGYRQGASDSEALVSGYNDQHGSDYEQAINGYTAKYGDLETYQNLFRQGYIDGYKAGWDFNSGQYSPRSPR